MSIVVVVVFVAAVVAGAIWFLSWFMCRATEEPRCRGGYISPKTPVSCLPKVPAGPAPGAAASPPPMHVDVNLISNAEGDKRAIQRTRDRAAAVRLHQSPRCRTCNHERVDGPRCDYCGTVAGIHAGQP